MLPGSKIIAIIHHIHYKAQKKPINNFQKTDYQKTNNCYNCEKPGYIAKYCNVRKQIKKLDLSEEQKNQLFKIINEQTSEEESKYYSPNLDSSIKIQPIKNSTYESETNYNNSIIKTCNCNNCIIGTTCFTDKH
ncbi:hypothetical protein CFOL_v3_30896 [Cephalotus follicularis]|uniref:CCHC-type domain-containing protein n=1 Tax=Cephalotus follicularis TaxID=3775 RepID=A0A1Q3D4R4_CEPFO|nr:hypothetical protein CFOL_v3_30896 [Cephalotus follicularis]